MRFESAGGFCCELSQLNLVLYSVGCQLSGLHGLKTAGRIRDDFLILTPKAPAKMPREIPVDLEADRPIRQSPASLHQGLIYGEEETLSQRETSRYRRPGQLPEKPSKLPSLSLEAHLP